MEIGPQPHGVVRSNIYAVMKAGVQHMLDWVNSYNSGITNSIPGCFCSAPMSFKSLNLSLSHFFFSSSGSAFEGGFVDVFTMVKYIDYPRDSNTHNITAAIHPELQVRFVSTLFTRAQAHDLQ